MPVVQAGQTRSTNVGAIADLRKGAWQTPTLNAPWTNYGGGYATCGYRRDGGVRVQLRGSVKDGAGGSVVFTLPAGVRPPAQISFATLSDPNGLARIDIKPNGEVTLISPSTGTLAWLSLDGIGFFVE